MKNLWWLTLGIILVFGCSGKNHKSDAYGNFEVDEIIISAESNGKIIDFPFEEGSFLKKNTIICQIDSTQIFLQKKEILAKLESLNIQKKIILSQIKQAETEKAKIERDVTRFQGLLKNNATTQKQLDDIVTNKKIIDEKIIQATLSKDKLIQEMASLNINLEKVNDQLSKTHITSPIDGIILKKYYQEGEFVSIGRPILTVADIDQLTLKAYISGDQLSQIKLGKSVKVLIDEKENSMKTYTGIISYISDKSEFTPKIIQTKKERISQVYAIKILVKNDGFLKIGMPAEVRF